MSSEPRSPRRATPGRPKMRQDGSWGDRARLGEAVGCVAGGVLVARLHAGRLRAQSRRTISAPLRWPVSGQVRLRSTWNHSTESCSIALVYSELVTEGRQGYVEQRRRQRQRGSGGEGRGRGKRENLLRPICIGSLRGHLGHFHSCFFIELWFHLVLKYHHVQVPLGLLYYFLLQ